MSVFSRFFQFLFPRRHELALFSMAVALCALILTAPDFRSIVYAGVSFVVGSISQAFDESTWEGIKALVGGGGLLLVTASSIGVSLYLPFTKRNFDVFLPIVIGIHLIVVMTSNFLLFEERQDIASAIIAGAGLLYFMLFAMAYRLRYLSTFTSSHHASPKQALIVALSVILFVALLTVGFNWHWAHSYACVLGYALLIDSVAKAFSG